MSLYWTEDFGPVYPPKNVEEVCAEANRLIDKFIAEYGDVYSYEFEKDLANYKAQLWESACMNNKVGEVEVLWPEEE